MKRTRQNGTGKNLVGFTLLEVVLSMGILALLSASVYAIANSAISASRVAMEEQLSLRRLDAFLRVTRDALLNLPADGGVELEMGKAAGGEAEPRLILGKARGLFGLPSLGGGSLVLSARPQADGTRTITLLRIPANASDRERADALSAGGIPLLPRIRKPRWTFFQDNQWKEEWPPESQRPELVRLQMDVEELPDPVEAVFYLPPVTPVVIPTPPPGQTPPSPTPEPSPAPAE